MLLQTFRISIWNFRYNNIYLFDVSILEYIENYQNETRNPNFPISQPETRPQ